MLTTGYTLSRTTSKPFEGAVERVRAELQRAGFGVLCEIDVQKTLHEKLGLELEPYLILGACNPPLAHWALSAEPELGVLLPCNVVVYEQSGETRIAAVDPERMLSIVDNDRARSCRLTARGVEPCRLAVAEGDVRQQPVEPARQRPCVAAEHAQ